MEYEIKKFTIKYYQDLKKIYLDCKLYNVKFDFHQTGSNFLMNGKVYKIKHHDEKIQAKLLIYKASILKSSSFLYSIENKNERFILYLAVKENYRNKGIGTYLLKWYLNANNDKEIYLNIDEINKTYDDYIIRKKRLDFYIKNNFYDTNYISINNDLISHILSNKQEFNVEKYKLFDKKISQYFLCKSDKITRLS